MNEQFEIGRAIKEMWNGYRVRRAGWNGKGMWLALHKGEPAYDGGPEPHNKRREQLPYVFMKTADDKIVPWLCSQTDLLAVDWEIAGEPS